MIPLTPPPPLFSFYSTFNNFYYSDLQFLALRNFIERKPTFQEGTEELSVQPSMAGSQEDQQGQEEDYKGEEAHQKLMRTEARQRINKIEEGQEDDQKVKEKKKIKK